MTHIEQHKMIQELREYEGRMNRQDLETFAMFRKRDADDEDLDAQSRAMLVSLHHRYVQRKVAKGNPLDDLFRT